MMVWNIEFTKEAQKDIRKLREPSKSHVNEAINKVAQNPLPFTEGGYGKPLGHKRDGNLTGYLTYILITVSIQPPKTISIDIITLHPKIAK